MTDELQTSHEEAIHHVSDTAVLVATFRANESDRPDAVFRDPLARRLSGERGAQIVAAFPSAEALAFAMVTRTTAIDRLVQRAIADGVDTVINLGAGLDTRPYRMDFPAALQWVEVDFPRVIDFKNTQLAGEAPVCDLRRIAADLSDDAVRRRLFAELGAATRKALVITEGVVGYLTNDHAAALSKDLLATPSFQYWIMDYAQGKRRKWGDKKVKSLLKESPIQFNAVDALGFFQAHGWRIAENIGILDEADRIGRPMPMVFPWGLLLKLFPGPLKKVGNKTYGYVLFERP